jgi:ferric-dicitrate binding protein FerR (iron transport regulator)
MSGRFGIKESEDFLRSLELAFSVSAKSNPDGTVSLSRSASQ